MYVFAVIFVARAVKREYSRARVKYPCIFICIQICPRRFYYLSLFTVDLHLSRDNQRACDTTVRAELRSLSTRAYRFVSRKNDPL